MRAFIAIDIGEREEIVKVMGELEKIKAKMKMVEPHNIHITLKFLGEIDERMVENIRKAIEKSIDGMQPFKAMLHGIGVFPSMQYMRVLWIGFEDEGQTKKIAMKLDDELIKYGFKRDKNFAPHVTIARIKGKEGKDEIKKFIEKYRDKKFGEIECHTIKLKKSILRKEGPLYETVEEIRI